MRGNSRRRGNGFGTLAVCDWPYQDLVKNAVIRAGEQGDLVSPGNRPGNTQRRQDGFRPRIAEGDSFHAGEIANQACYLTDNRRLRPNFDPALELIFQRANDEIG